MNISIIRASKSRPACRWPFLLGVAMCILAAAGSSLAQTERPKVAVAFDMSQSPFAAMPAQDQQAVAQAAVDKLAASATRRWGFLDWVPAGSGAFTADATWTIRMEVSIKTITLPNGQPYQAEVVYLKHFADVGGEVYSLLQSESAELLYDFGKPKPLQSPQVLEEDVLEKLDEQLDTALRGEGIDRVLFKVRLTEGLVFDEANQQIIVPFRLSDLRAEQEVRFKVQLVPVQAVRDDFELEEGGAVDATGELEGYIIAKITDWSVRSIPASTPTWWVDDLPEYVSQFDGAHVFMLEYSPNLAGAASTSNGIVLDPDQ